MARKFRPKAGATAVMLFCLAILLGLGSWQIQRLGWKEQLIATISAQMAKPAVPMPAVIDAPQEWQYRRVSMAGQFMHDLAVLVKPRTQDGKVGAHMVVPFLRAGGGIVFVNRGFVSDDVMEKVTKPQGIIKIEGILTLPQKGSFTPENNPDKNEWYWPDVAAMAKAASLEGAAPVLFESADKTENVYPQGGTLRLDIPNDHRQYAFFWFAMAAGLLVIYFIYHFRDEKDAGL